MRKCLSVFEKLLANDFIEFSQIMSQQFSKIIFRINKLIA